MDSNALFSIRSQTLICMVIAIILRFQLTASAQGGPGLWGAKVTTLRDVQKRATFKILLPRQASKVPLTAASLGWLKSDPVYISVVQSRQIACLFSHVGGTQRNVAILQAVSQGKDRRNNNLYQAVAEGLFFDRIRKGTYLQFGSASGIDFLILVYLPKASNSRSRAIAESIATQFEKQDRKRKFTSKSRAMTIALSRIKREKIDPRQYHVSVDGNDKRQWYVAFTSKRPVLAPEAGLSVLVDRITGEPRIIDGR